LSGVELKAVKNNLFLAKPKEYKEGVICTLVRGKWRESESVIKFKVDCESLAHGGMRSAHRLALMNGMQYMCKLSLKGIPEHNAKTTLGDMASLQKSEEFSILFNSRNDFDVNIGIVTPQAIRLNEGSTRERKLYLPIEPFIMPIDSFKNFNDNDGDVTKETGGTPQRFSHFTYVKSKGEFLVVDLQGWRDETNESIVYIFTDPLVHSKKREGFGKGRLRRKRHAQVLQNAQLQEERLSGQLVGGRAICVSARMARAKYL
jgi:hypothetical protein